MPSSCDAWCARRTARARPLVGDRGLARRDAARGAGCRRDQGRAARRLPVPLVQRLRHVGSLQALGHGRPQEPDRPRSVPEACRRCRRAGRDVPAGGDRPARHRVRRTAGAQRAARVRLVSRISRRPSPRPASRLRRARAGERRPAVGTAGVAHGARLPARTAAEHGGDVPRPDGHPRRARRARTDRSRPARTDIVVPGDPALHDPDLDVRREFPLRLLRDDGEGVPARCAPGDDLRGRRQRMGAHVDHEWPAAGQEPGRARRRARGIRPVAVPDALTGGARPHHAHAAGGVQAAQARRPDRHVPREQPRGRGDRAHGRDAGSDRFAAPPARRERHDRDGRRPRLRADDTGRRAVPLRNELGRHQGPAPARGAAQRRGVGELGYSAADIAGFTTAGVS